MRTFTTRIAPTTRRLAALGGLALLLAAVFAVASPGLASAHAKFGSSNPAPNAVLLKAPTTITITFTEKLDPSGSDIIVYDQTGKQVSTGKAAVDRSDLTKMSVQMKGDDSEGYSVVWRSKSLDDGDPFTGAYGFTVSADATPSAGDTSTPTSSSGGTTRGEASSGGTPAWLTALIGVLGLAVGAGGMYYFSRRTPAA
jgi:methionine-rich copper-binding protein CopC